MRTIANVFESAKITTFRFDFAGNGWVNEVYLLLIMKCMLLALLMFMSFFRESQGSFQYGNYRREAEDLRSVLQHLRGENRVISAIIGHSKGKEGGFLVCRFQEKGNNHCCYCCCQVGMWCFCMQQSTRMWRLL